MSALSEAAPVSRSPAAELRIGFISGRPMTTHDGIHVEPSLGRLIDALRRRCSQFSLALSATNQQIPLYNYPIDLPANRIHAFPTMLSTAQGFFKIRSCRKVIREVEAASDVVIVQLPFQSGAALFSPRTPRVYQVCADVFAVALTSTHYRGPKRIAALSVARILDRIQAKLIRRSDARHVSHGGSLWRHYGMEQGRAVISSTLLEDEVQSVMRKRPTDAPFRILFVGYIRHEKGVDVLLDAFKQILAERKNVELHLVGPASISDPEFEQVLRRKLSALDNPGSVTIVGPRDFGPELFQCYADADVLVVPSRSEGTPRVLIEARAFSCPVIASDVGGIPTSIQHENDGLLVPPNDSTALASSIQRLMDDDSLRHTLITNGLALARKTTIEALADSLLEEMLKVAPQGIQRHSR